MADAGVTSRKRRLFPAPARYRVCDRVPRCLTRSLCPDIRMVACPICSKPVKESKINVHIDSACEAFVETAAPPTLSQQNGAPVASFFRTPSAKKPPTPVSAKSERKSSLTQEPPANGMNQNRPLQAGVKRQLEPQASENGTVGTPVESGSSFEDGPSPKRPKGPTALQKVAPLAERMRPRTLDDVYGQELVGPTGVLRGLIETDRVPSMILWGGPGTGKTTIARVIASMVESRFVYARTTFAELKYFRG